MNTEVKREITRSERTRFVYDEVEKLKLTSSEFCDFDLDIASLMKGAMAIADSDDYIKK